MFWSLKIEIGDLFEIWCFKFGNLKPLRYDWIKLYFDVTLIPRVYLDFGGHFFYVCILKFNKK
jgi:hypothetical protein